MRNKRSASIRALFNARQQRMVGLRVSGPCFHVWDDDARSAIAWGTELKQTVCSDDRLRAVGSTRKPKTDPVEIA